MLVCPRCSSLFVRDVGRCGLDGERLVEVERDPLIGATVDRYRIVDLLGEGGMARVYRAEHAHLGHAVALKVLHGDTASDRQQAERFKREARSAARIRHPHVVEVHDFGVSSEGLVFMAMELLEGVTLAQRLTESRPLALEEIAEIVRQAALGLGAAHRLGFVHRDLTPKNVMLARRGGRLRVVLLDFGLVRSLDSTDPRLTALGQVYGTPAYMAPEQIADAPLDGRSDLYALGVILYELLAGRRPFAGALGDVLDAHRRGAAPPLDDRSGLGALAMSLMSKLPSDRPGRAEDVVVAIEALALAGFGEVAPSLVTAPATERAAPRAVVAEDTARIRRERRTSVDEPEAITQAVPRPAALRLAPPPDVTAEVESVDAMMAGVRSRWPAMAVAAGLAVVGIAFGYPWLAASSAAPPAVASAGEAPAVAAIDGTPEAAPSPPRAARVARVGRAAKAPAAPKPEGHASARSAERGRAAGGLLPRLPPKRGTAEAPPDEDEVDPHEPDEAPVADAPRAADAQPARDDDAKGAGGASATSVEEPATPPIPEVAEPAAPAPDAPDAPDAPSAPSVVAPPEAALPALEDAPPEATLPAIAEVPLGAELTDLEKALLAELPDPEALPATPLTRTASSAAP